MTDTKLLPCPFCGDAARVVLADDQKSVECVSCGAASCIGSEGRAIAAWNRRAGSASGGAASGAAHPAEPSVPASAPRAAEAVEKVAREVCTLVGRDPDEVLSDGESCWPLYGEVAASLAKLAAEGLRRLHPAQAAAAEPSVPQGWRLTQRESELLELAERRGMVLVPVEAPNEMLAAGAKTLSLYRDDMVSDATITDNIYRAMLSAAPPPDAPRVVACNCAGKAPTVPTYRGSCDHLPDCPAYGIPKFPVGGTALATETPSTIVRAVVPSPTERPSCAPDLGSSRSVDVASSVSGEPGPHHSASDVGGGA